MVRAGRVCVSRALSPRLVLDLSIVGIVVRSAMSYGVD
jgi:hypothetical protein